MSRQLLACGAQSARQVHIFFLPKKPEPKEDHERAAAVLLHQVHRVHVEDIDDVFVHGEILSQSNDVGEYF